MADPRGQLRREIRRFWGALGSGSDLGEAAGEAGVAVRTAYRWMRECGGVRAIRVEEPSAYRVGFEDRERIAFGLAAGWSFTEIRSAERRVGKEWFRTCRFRWSPVY